MQNHEKSTTVGRYLVRRLEQLGLGHIFGVPGDYVLRFLDLLEESNIDVINTCSELNAGYAADAYARTVGIGAVCITYGVGGFSVYNAIAGAFAERVPLVVISGGPRAAMRGRLHPFLLHHTIGNMNLQQVIYEKIVEASAILSANHAARQIDDTLAACLRHSRPVYIEIPADVVDQPCTVPDDWKPDLALHMDADVLDEAVGEAAALIKSASNPVILAGVEAYRLKTRDALLDFVRRSGFPVATTALGKGVVPEHWPNFVGTYVGGLANEFTQQMVERSDLLLCLGSWMTDIDLGGYTAKLDPNRMVIANSEKIRIKRHIYEHVPLKDFLMALARLPLSPPATRPPKPSEKPHIAVRDARLTTDRFWQRMDSFLEDDHIVIADTGSALFDSLKLHLPDKADFISQAFYASIGYAVPAALGAGLAAPSCRPVVFVGDGGFQMTGQELSNIIRYGLNPVIFLLNNDGYQVERVIYDNEYNNLQMWDYSALPEVYGGAKGVCVTTEGELESFIDMTRHSRDSLCFAEIRLGKLDFSDTLRKIGERLR